MGIISIFYSGVLGVQSVTIRNLIAYSRVRNIGWTVICMIVTPYLFMWFLSFYFTLLGLLFLKFSQLQYTSLDEVGSTLRGSF